MNQKQTLRVQLRLRDSPGCTGVVREPSWCRVDPQKLENAVEKPVGRGKRGLAGGRRGREEAGWNPLFPPSFHLQGVMERRAHSPLLHLLQGDFADAGTWLVMHGLGVFFVIFFLFLSSSTPIHLSASWDREHNLCKKSSFGEKSVFKEFLVYARSCVWNCFTSVTSNT